MRMPVAPAAVAAAIQRGRGSKAATNSISSSLLHGCLRKRTEDWRQWWQPWPGWRNPSQCCSGVTSTICVSGGRRISILICQKQTSSAQLWHGKSSSPSKSSVTPRPEKVQGQGFIRSSSADMTAALYDQLVVGGKTLEPSLRPPSSMRGGLCEGGVCQTCRQAAAGGGYLHLQEQEQEEEGEDEGVWGGGGCWTWWGGWKLAARLSSSDSGGNGGWNLDSTVPAAGDAASMCPSSTAAATGY